MEIKKQYPDSFYTEDFIKSCTGLLSSYLWLGDIASITYYMTLTGDLLKVKPELWSAIPEREKSRLKLIGTALKAGLQPNPWGLQKPLEQDNEIYKEIKMTFDIKEKENEELNIEYEKDLQKILYSTYDSIEFLTNDKSKLIISNEVNTKNGRIDIKAQGKEFCHIIELKLKNADHKIVGQLMKYARIAGSKLHQGLYEEINLISVAESYDNSTILDLKSIGANIFTYRIEKENIVFNKV